MGINCRAQSEPTDFDKSLALFFETKYEQALPLIEQMVTSDQNNIEARTWLAETYRRLGRKDEAIKSAQIALGMNDCYSFAHLVIAQASYPDDQLVSMHVTKAVECDSLDPNGWLMMSGIAIREGNLELRNKCLKKLVETGFFTKAALAYGRIELQNLPVNAVLFTNGDMDTYPALAVQVTEGFRPDVAVIEREHLGYGWGCRFIQDFQHVPLPYPNTSIDSLTDSIDANGTGFSKSDQHFRALILQKQLGKFERPIAIAPTVEESFYTKEKEHFKYQGMFLLWQPQHNDGQIDTLAIRKCLKGINPDSFSGSWASTKDRSPVRRCYTKEMVRIIFEMALIYSEGLIEDNKYIQAEEMLKWLEDFEMHTEIGKVSTEFIVRLRGMMKK